MKLALALANLAGISAFALVGCGTPPTYQALMQDVLIEADYWEDEPRIMAVGLGFTDINGTPGVSLPLGMAEFAVFLNGGAWNTIHADVDPNDVPLRAYTSAVSPVGMALGFGVPSFYGDGTPMELSWPVLPSTVHPEDILITLNTGEQVQPVNISIMPNFEYNERSTLVMNGDFGNRLDPGESGAVYPVLFEIVDDGTPMQLLGPGGRIESAVGLSYGDGDTPLTAYGAGNGPTLCAAKLTRMADGVFIRPSLRVSSESRCASPRGRVASSGWRRPASRIRSVTWVRSRSLAWRILAHFKMSTTTPTSRITTTRLTSF